MKKLRLRDWALIGLLFLIFTASPAEAQDRPELPISHSCAVEGTRAVVYFDMEPGNGFWSIVQDGEPLRYGETDNAADDRYLQLLEVTPDVEVYVYVASGDRVDTHSFVCETDAGKWPEEIMVPEVSPRSFGFWRFWRPI